MKKLIFLMVLVACVAARKRHAAYEKHLKKFGKTNEGLTNHVDERREQNYIDNMQKIKEHNENPHATYLMDENKLTDRHSERVIEELCRTNLPATARSLPSPPSVYPATNAPLASVNWTSKCLPIVNQGTCGSCWAFATAAVIECYNKIRNKAIEPLSQQHLVDCDSYDGGCNGGWPTNALNYIKNVLGTKLATTAQYAYAMVKNACRTNITPVALNFASYFEKNLNGDENQLLSIVSNYGPVAVAMYVPKTTFQNYKTGVFSDVNCPKSNATFNQCSVVNHGVVVVGYGICPTTKSPYWLVRNSWGLSWGEQGYIRIIRNQGNNCNVACYAMGVE